MMRVSHLALLAAVEPDALCVVCGSARPELQCERCGIAMHGDCHWSSLATAPELAGLRAMVADGVDRWIPFLCQGCRS